MLFYTFIEMAEKSLTDINGICYIFKLNYRRSSDSCAVLNIILLGRTFEEQ